MELSRDAGYEEETLRTRASALNFGGDFGLGFFAEEAAEEATSSGLVGSGGADGFFDQAAAHGKVAGEDAVFHDGLVGVAQAFAEQGTDAHEELGGSHGDDFEELLERLDGDAPENGGLDDADGSGGGARFEDADFSDAISMANFAHFGFLIQGTDDDFEGSGDDDVERLGFFALGDDDFAHAILAESPVKLQSFEIVGVEETEDANRLKLGNDFGLIHVLLI